MLWICNINNWDVPPQLHEGLPHPQVRKHHCQVYLPSYPAGSISSDIWIVNQKEINIGRIIIYLAVGGIMLNSFDNFHTMDEIVGHLPRPTAFTVLPSPRRDMRLKPPKKCSCPTCPSLRASRPSISWRNCKSPATTTSDPSNKSNPSTNHCPHWLRSTWGVVPLAMMEIFN